MPDVPERDGAPHVTKYFWWMNAGFDDAVILTNQFMSLIATDFAETVIGIEDSSIGVSDADNGVLVKGEFLIGQCQAIFFTIGNQLGDAPRERFDIVFDQRDGHALIAWEQALYGIAQRTEGIFAVGQFAAKFFI